jgi:hypothetical protein
MNAKILFTTGITLIVVGLVAMILSTIFPVSIQLVLLLFVTHGDLSTDVVARTKKHTINKKWGSLTVIRTPTLLKEE